MILLTAAAGEIECDAGLVGNGAILRWSALYAMAEVDDWRVFVACTAGHRTAMLLVCGLSADESVIATRFDAIGASVSG